ncbi:MAG: SRPBCC family protein [Deltaproteobacteria bacterium]|nr:SRPBCC family protein [Deltaproteobacteria bacterium]
MLHCLRSKQILGIPVDEAWKYFSDPYNLANITPPALSFKVTSPQLPEMYPGLIISYEVRPLLGIPMTWVTEITHVISGHSFVDEQRVGPYRMWHHEHFFRECADGTEIEDVVHYVIGAFVLDPVIHRYVVGPRVQQIFDYRRKRLEELFPARKRNE